jgi:RNA polymerase sigma factor (sigma-70 family)
MDTSGSRGHSAVVAFAVATILCLRSSGGRELAPPAPHHQFDHRGDRALYLLAGLARLLFPAPGRWYDLPVGEDHTTSVVQRYLNQLAEVPGDAPAEPIVRQLLAGAVNRLQVLCASMLYRSYSRLTQPPLNLQTDEMLGAVVERMLKAMRSVRPQTVRQFFALANQHIRWELNDLARRLDKEARAPLAHESQLAAPLQSSESQLSPNARRILDAIEALPEEEREVFSLLRIQELTQPEAAEILGVSAKTVQRRLNRSLMLLAETLKDLRQAPELP